MAKLIITITTYRPSCRALWRFELEKVTFFWSQNPVSNVIGKTMQSEAMWGVMQRTKGQWTMDNGQKYTFSCPMTKL